MQKQTNFSEIKNCNKIWAIGSIHSRFESFNSIKKYLLENNFIAIKLHDTNFREQVDLFHNAECIVGLHGGGFGNIVFCKPGTKVIELRSSYAGPVIENLAKKNDLNYHSFYSFLQI